MASESDTKWEAICMIGCVWAIAFALVGMVFAMAQCEANFQPTRATQMEGGTR